MDLGTPFVLPDNCLRCRRLSSTRWRGGIGKMDMPTNNTTTNSSEHISTDMIPSTCALTQRKAKSRTSRNNKHTVQYMKGVLPSLQMRPLMESEPCHFIFLPDNSLRIYNWQSTLAHGTEERIWLNKLHEKKNTSQSWAIQHSHTQHHKHLHKLITTPPTAQN